MEEEEQVVTPEGEQVEETEQTPEEVKVDAEAEARRQLTARAKRAESELKVAKAEADRLRNQATKSLDVEDYIDISASLEGLDQREKSYLAEQHKLTGKPLAAIREDENFNLWQSAYRAKVEKEQLSLKPSGTQSESDRPMSFSEKLKNASLADKEQMLREAGLYKDPRPRADRVSLGRGK